MSGIGHRTLRTALLLSLLLNGAVLAGFLYQHFLARPDTSIAAVAARLGLDATERQALAAMRRAVFAQVRELRRRSAEPNARLRELVAGGAADDPELTRALARIAEERARIQHDAIARLIAYRDGLSPEARRRFAAAMRDKGFMLSMFGVSSWGLPSDPAAQ